IHLIRHIIIMTAAPSGPTARRAGGYQLS
ncbi:MAG: hypothetical protein UV02_C0028G0009, partial [Candidatus Kuenenbacteria bacterium GW2011_GWA2_42_15]